MSVDLTITVSIIIALCAIVSPIIVAIINNRHNIKIRYIDIANDYKMKAFEKYLDDVRKLTSSDNENLIYIYNQSFSSAMLYASSNTLQFMFEIDSLISSRKIDTIDSNKIIKLCKLLQKDLGIYKSK